MKTDPRDALVQAAFDGKLAAVRKQLAPGAKVNQPGTARYRNEHKVELTWEGLPLAAAIRHLDILRVLVEHGAQVTARDADGWTPLHHAALNASVDAVRLLLEHGADPNAVDESGSSPLHRLTAASGKREPLAVARLLLAAGADPRAMDGLRRFPSGTGLNRDVKALLAKEMRKKRPTASAEEKPKPTPNAKLAAVATKLMTKPHPILNGALEKATPEERPPPPIHRGGPPVVCPAIATIDLAIWMGDLALEISGERGGPGAEALALARAFRRSPPEKTARTGHGEEKTAKPGTPEHVYGRLVDASTDRKKESAAVAIARRAAGAAASMCKGKYDVVWVHAKAAAQRMVPLLRASRGGAAAVRDFLTELDRRILCAEMTSAALRNVKPELPQPLVLADVLWRGPDLFVGRFDDGDRFAFLGKTGRTWTWSVGKRDDVLACVPDDHFAAATDAVLAAGDGSP